MMVSNRIPRDKAISLCDKSIRGMMERYQKKHNASLPLLIRKRIKLRLWIKSSGQHEFTREEFGLVETGWLLKEIAAIGSMIPKTNRFTNGSKKIQS